MDHVADPLDRAADRLTETHRRLLRPSVPAEAFGASDGTTQPARLGRELHARFTAALQARADEAAAAATGLSHTADAIRRTADDYATTDTLVHHRLSREL